jgi:hypothetical protein
MSVYWLTFRIENDAGYRNRYDALIEAIRVISSKWWVEPTSFLLFESARDIDGVAAVSKAAINPRIDMALVGMPDFKSARLVGASTDQDIFALMPFTKKAG